ncbi:MAG: hypothetical protein Q9225_004022 [Loekoesia sp. 1 TL-2023]
MLNWNPDKELPDLSGKVIFVTGVHRLAEHHPEKIYFTGRDETRANDLIARINGTVPSANVVFIKVDMASLDSVKTAFEQFDLTRLDILICNAGIMAVPPALTKDGYEMQFGVNYLAHALLVKLFLPLLLETAKLPDADVRVVIMTSLGYRMAPKNGVDFKNIKTTQDTGPGAPWMRYGQSKTADILLAKELAKRYPQITSTSIHPGVVKTGLVSNLTFGAKAVVYVGCFMQGIKMIESDEGCYNMLWAAAGDKTGIVNGELYEPVGILSKTKSKARANPRLPGELWEWTEKALASY